MRRYHPHVDPLDPEAALQYAAKHMYELLLRYDGSATKALAAYNAGVVAVDQAVSLKGEAWLRSMPQETQLYIEKIMLPGEPDTPPRWQMLKSWWLEATEAMGQRMHLRLLLGSMVSVTILPAPPQDLPSPPTAQSDSGLSAATR